MSQDLLYVCDNKRHLVCLPYSVANLHRMASELELAAGWYQVGKGKPHYDIPVRRIAEIQAKCRVVSPKQVLQIIQGTLTEL
jgi:hypothetical protein